MSVQSANYIINTFGLGSLSIEQLENLYSKHAGPCETKDEITGNQKLINTLISMAEQKGGETISFAVRLVKSITCSMKLSLLEGNVIRILEFAKAVILYCPNYESKNTGMWICKLLQVDGSPLTGRSPADEVHLQQFEAADQPVCSRNAPQVQGVCLLPSGLDQEGGQCN